MNISHNHFLSFQSPDLDGEVHTCSRYYFVFLVVSHSGDEVLVNL